MSTVTEQRAGAIPQWTLGWRLQRALSHAGMKVEDMADELSVSRSTLSRWMNDRGSAPRPIFVRQWALMCGVSPEWLMTGRDVGVDEGPDGEGLPQLDSNQQPAG